jgi:sugar lactone lactonase YvrE
MTLLASGLAGGTGSTVGPGGALYVAENIAGRISRIDPRTGTTTTFAAGLPPAIVNLNGTMIGGVMDIAFIGSTAYVLVTLVASDVGGTSAAGIYRIDGPQQFTLIADLGSYSQNHPPNTSFFIPTGVQYAIEAYRGGFLVTDGHHNRVLHVTSKGEITEVIEFGNIVPTGLAVAGNIVLMAQAGPVPHHSDDGRILAFGPKSSSATTVATGAPLLVDVEYGRGRRLYALSQGIWTGGEEGSPASPNTGALVEVNGNGSFSSIVNGLDRPTSVEFIGNTAYIVTIPGQVWTIDGVSCPPFGDL